MNKNMDTIINNFLENIMGTDIENQNQFNKKKAEQERSLALKSGLDLKLSIENTLANQEMNTIEMSRLREAGFDIHVENLDKEDMLFILSKVKDTSLKNVYEEGNLLPLFFFIEMHHKNEHILTNIIEVVDNDLVATLTNVLTELEEKEEEEEEEKEKEKEKEKQQALDFNFGQALEALKAGNKIARKGWNGKGMYLILIRAGNAVCQGYDMQDCIGMKTANNLMQPGWLASQADILAEDWEVL